MNFLLATSVPPKQPPELEENPPLPVQEVVPNTPPTYSEAVEDTLSDEEDYVPFERNSW